MIILYIYIFRTYVASYNIVENSRTSYLLEIRNFAISVRIDYDGRELVLTIIPACTHDN